jgi:hypothetical protein
MTAKWLAFAFAVQDSGALSGALGELLLLLCRIRARFRALLGPDPKTVRAVKRCGGSNTATSRHCQIALLGDKFMLL